MLRGHPHFPLSYNPLRRNRFHSHRVLFYISWFSFRPLLQKWNIMEIFHSTPYLDVFCAVGLHGFGIRITFSDIRTMNQTKVFILQPKSCSLPSRSTPAFIHKQCHFGLMLCSFWIWKHFLSSDIFIIIYILEPPGNGIVLDAAPESFIRTFKPIWSASTKSNEHRENK